MTTLNISKEKWMVIADYPTSRFKVGEVVTNFPLDYLNPDDFPAIFQKIDEDPVPDENPDFRKLVLMAKQEVENVKRGDSKRTYSSMDYYEQVMYAVFGDGILKWMNKQL